MKSIFAYFLMVATILMGTLIFASDNDPILTWDKNRLSVLMIKKNNNNTVLPPFLEIIKWLIQKKGMDVFVEEAVTEELKANSLFKEVQNNLKLFQKNNPIDKIDFIICIGGHGTLFYANSLFKQTVPPIMSFPMDPPGTLTPFRIQDFKEEITNVIEGHATYFIRNRLECKLIKEETGSKKPIENLSVLNDVIIEHGSNHLFSLSLYLDGHFITNVEGDGLVISTPTGSSAFAASTGSSLIHPKVSAVLLSAICPYLLSFRSVLVPADIEIKVKLNPEDTRTTYALVTFDGRNKQKLSAGDSIEIKASTYPVLTINPKDTTNMNWFGLLSKAKNWNVRPKQKAIDDKQNA